jgi:hypothetical protein
VRRFLWTVCGDTLLLLAAAAALGLLLGLLVGGWGGVLG